MYINSLIKLKEPQTRGSFGTSISQSGYRMGGFRDSSEPTGLSKRKDSRGAFECAKSYENINNNEDFKSGNVTEKSNVTALSFNGKGRLLKSDGFANLLEKIDSHNQTYNALVALITAGLIRPIFTMAVPGVKDKKDKIYSAGQAISSGVLGFGVTMLLTRPLDDALKKVKNPMKDKKEAAALTKIAKNIPEWIICIPRAMLTIALIPFILKYVFGLEKPNKNKSAAQNIQQTETQKNQYDKLKTGKNIKEFGAKPVEGQPSFGAKIVNMDKVARGTKDLSWFGEQYEKFTDAIAKHITTPLVNSKVIQKLAQKWKNSDFLFNHIATVTSFAISSTYATRTLQNKNLEDDKRKILALNQGLTWMISTVLSYTLDSKLENWWQRITAKFIGARIDDKNFADEYAKLQRETKAKIKELKHNGKNSKIKIPKAIELAKSKKLIMPSNMENMVNGLDVLKKMAVIGAIFRLAVPVLVTPIAANLGDKYLEHKRQKQTAKQ